MSLVHSNDLSYIFVFISSCYQFFVFILVLTPQLFNLPCSFIHKCKTLALDHKLVYYSPIIDSIFVS